MDSTTPSRILLGRRDDSGNSGTDKLLQLLQSPFKSSFTEDSIWASLGTSLVVTALLTLLFSVLRPYNTVVYAPKLKHADEKHAPPPLGKGFFAWLGPVLKTKEQDLVGTVGLDATIFLRFTRMLRNMFLSIAILGCGILIPINWTNDHVSGTSFYARITPLNTFGEPNWGIAICAWLFNIIIAGFLWWNYRKVLGLRRQYFDSPEYQSSLHARTLMVNDLPKGFRTDEGIAKVIDAVVPNSSFSRTAIGRNVKELPELIEEHQKHVRKLEQYLASYLKDPANLPNARPLCKPSKKDPSYGSYPKGQKVDAIDYLTGRIRDLELEIKEVRTSIDKRNPMPYGFASYEDIAEAHSIAYAARKQHPQGTTIALAPRPNDIIWNNMPLSPKTRRWRRLVNNFWISLLTVAWIAPNAMISIFLVNLSNLGAVWPAFQTALEANTPFWSIVQGVASPAITSIVFLVLPIIFRRLSINAGDRTKTSRERHVISKLYSFFVFNNLIVFSVFSSLWTFISNVIVNTNKGTNAWDAIEGADFTDSLFQSLCDISPFWVTWLLQRNIGAAIDLGQLWTLFLSFCQRKFSSPTPREMIELTAPPSFDYASYYNYFLYYATVALCYATLQPLVLPAAALYFAIDVYLKKYLLLYIFITKTESGGVYWRVVFNRIIFAAILSNLVVFLAVWSNGDGRHYEAFAVVPPPFLMLAFKWWCMRKFDDKIHYFSVANKIKNPEAIYAKDNLFGHKNDRLASRFGHPALYKPLITPMVHAKAQNILAAIYRGRLTDSNNAGSDDMASMSGYSDTYVLENMSNKGRPGRSATRKGGVPGFEIVPEANLDFAYYKNRTDFADEFGGGGNLYGRNEDLVSERSQTPQSFYRGVDRSGSPSQDGYGSPGRIQSPERRQQSPGPSMPNSLLPGGRRVPQGGMGFAKMPPIYQQVNESETELGLMAGAADMAFGTSGGRDGSPGPRAPGFLGGGHRGYGGLPQEEHYHEDAMGHGATGSGDLGVADRAYYGGQNVEDIDDTSYDNFRRGRQNAGWQGGF